ncbi:hypothetical protein DYH10_03435 [Candidatus Saccharibacteria bacterium CPR2]|nr:hypothetical protein [Candidatus Saccharibacteria bacterium CPR2]
MADQRLPVVGSDDGQWGTILNQFLEKEHYNTGVDNVDNGGHKTVTIRAGTATAGTAPLKFTSGTVLTTPEAGAMEFNSDSLYFTTTTGPTRKTVAWTDFSNVSGTLGVANGGTGATTLTGILKGNGTSAFTAVTAPSGDIVGTTDTQTLSNKTLTTPKIADLGYIADPNGNEYVIFDSVSSAVNEITITNAVTTTAPQIAATGGDTNVSLNLSAKGTGALVAKSDLNMEDENVYFTEYDNGTKTTNFTVDWTVGQKQKVTINAAGPLTVTFTAPAGPCNLLIKIVQGSTPGTLSWPGTVKWPGGTAPTLSGSTNQVDIASFYYDGTNYNGVANLNFS